MILLPWSGGELSPLIDELDAWRTKLDHRGPLPRAWAGRLRRDLEAEAVAASTSMEGVPVTVEEVRRILAGDRPTDVSAHDRDLVEGYREAMSFVLRRADDPAFAWSPELIVGMHDRILAGRYAEGAGRVRADRAAFVVNSATGEQVFMPPSGEEVGGLLAEMCELVGRSDAHAAETAAWVHVAVAAIHPFRDGNGRVARVLASLAMYRKGFKRTEFTSLEEWWGRHLPEYYEAFACLGSDFDRRADVTPFMRTHIEAQLHQVRALDLRERVQRQIWLALEGVVADVSLNLRVANASWDAFFGDAVTAGYYRSVADISPATATSDLAAAVSAGILSAHGRRRGRRYVATERLYGSVAGELDIELGDTADARDRIVSEIGRRLSE